MPLDHVVVATADFEASARAFRNRFGLESQAGGRHPGWGTANWIVPLGSAYIELVGIDDATLAATTSFGRRVAESSASGGGPIGWCVRPADFAATTTRLGLKVEPGSRIAPDGRTLEWRVAGVDVAMANPALPFFIDWDVSSERHPGRLETPVETRLRALELRGDPDEIGRWLADEDLPVLVRPGTPAVLRIELEVGDMAIAIQGR
jgi:hypothetical protein